MNARRVVTGAFVAVALVATVLLSSGGDKPYRVRLVLANAAGLRSGSDVTIGGVKAGTVSVHLGRGDEVIADLDLDRSQAPVGKDASAAIAAVNFLGRKRVELDKGNTSDPAPSGFVIPATHVTTSTDLDQVLDVLDAETRARLTILINEAGGALAGRREDVSRLLAELPHSMVSATTLLNRLVNDNHTLAHLVTASDRFVAQIASRRQSLARMIDVVGETAQTVATRRAQLAQTLSRAPVTLATLRRFLGDLRATTAPLGPAARGLTTTAPPLSDTLAQVEPFRRAADPALAAATHVAPALAHLGRRATPVLRKAIPTTAALANLTTALPPLSHALDHSIDNILAVVENWSRAIQFRDGLSHVFRGEASVTPESLRSLVDRLLPKAGRHTRRHTISQGGVAPTRTPSLPTLTPHLPTLRVPRLPELLGKRVTQSLPPRSDVHQLLDYLLK